MDSFVLPLRPVACVNCLHFADYTPIWTPYMALDEICLELKYVKMSHFLVSPTCNCGPRGPHGITQVEEVGSKTIEVC